MSLHDSSGETPPELAGGDAGGDAYAT